MAKPTIKYFVEFSVVKQKDSGFTKTCGAKKHAKKYLNVFQNVFAFYCFFLLAVF